MKKGILKYFTIVMLVFFLAAPIICQEQQEQQDQVPPQPQPELPEFQEELNLGRVYFPRDFVHAQKDYRRGTYRLKLVSKEDTPFFRVSNRKGEFLFEEMAIVKPYKGKARKFRYRLRKEMLRGYEYFRIQVTRPDKILLGYFLVKKKEPAPAKEEKKEEEDKKFF